MTLINAKKAEDGQVDPKSISNFIDTLKSLHPELRDARFRGLHATTAKRVDSIVEKGGFDFNLTGRNFKGFTLQGSGVYITDNPFRAIQYAGAALSTESQESGVSSGQPQDAATHEEHDDAMLQMLAVFELPRRTDESGKVVPLEPAKQETMNFLSVGGSETRIPPEAISSDKVSYIAIPLPPYRPADSMDLAYMLHAAMSAGKK